MINVVAIIRSKPGQADHVRAALLKLIPPTHAEPANEEYVLHVSADDPNLFVFYETWESRAALDEHLATPHLTALGVEIGDALAAPLEIHVLEQLGGKR